MSDDLHNDPFESSFRKKLNPQDPTPSDDGWDMPDDQVWEKIQDRIGNSGMKPGRNSNATWIWVLAGVVIFIAVLYTCNIQPKSTNGPIVTLSGNEAVQEKGITKGAEIKNEIVSENDVKDEEKAEQKKGQRLGLETVVEPRQSPIKDSTHSSTSNTSGDKPKQNRTAETGKKISNDDKIAEKENKVSAPGNDTSLKGAGESEKVPVAGEETRGNTLVAQPEEMKNDAPTFNGQEPAEPRSLMTLVEPVLPKQAILNASETALTLPPDFKLSAPVISKKGGSGRFYAGIYYAPAQYYRKIEEPDQIRRKQLNQFEQPTKTLASGGLRLGYKLASRWSLESGLQYNKVQLQSTHNVQLVYNPALEMRNANGGYDSNQPVVLPTSFGEISTDVALTRNASTTIPVNASTQIVFEVTQDLQHLYLPLALRYELGHGKVRWTLRAGLAANFLLDKQVRIARVRSNRIGLLHRQTKVIDKFRGLNTVTLDYLVGLGISYQLTPAVSLLAEPSWMQSMTPALERGQLKTYPNLFSMNLGINYNF